MLLCSQAGRPTAEFSQAWQTVRAPYARPGGTLSFLGGIQLVSFVWPSVDEGKVKLNILPAVLKW